MGRIIEDPNELKSILDEEKRKGKIIVFGNGCFDILHVGHIRYLRDAKSLGDILVVAINDDVSFKKLGKRRSTIFPLKERAEVLASISYVDYVIPFSDETVEKLILFLKPEIHAKGTDYTEGTVPERNVVLSYGGRVAIVGDPKDHSTTEIIRKIKEDDY